MPTQPLNLYRLGSLAYPDAFPPYKKVSEGSTRPAGRIRTHCSGKSSRFFVSGFYSEFEMGASRQNNISNLNHNKSHDFALLCSKLIEFAVLLSSFSTTKTGTGTVMADFLQS